MKYLSLIICGLFAFQLTAQNAVEKHFSNHLENQEATVVQVSGKLFQYAAALAPEDEIDIDIPVDDVKEMLANITSFTLVKVDSLVNVKKEYRRGVSKLEDSYEELVRVSDKDNNLSIFIDESNDVIYEIVGVVSTEGEFVVASLTGEMRMDQIQKIISEIQSEEMNSMLRGTDIDIDEMKVFPNPANANTDFKVVVPQKMIGGTVTVYDINGSKVLARDADDAQLSIATNNIGSGQYVVEIQKDGVTLKKKLILMQ